ncbi:MAG: DUF885 family protein [Actinomycetes bacterium]
MSLLETATSLTERYRDLVVAHQPVEATAIGLHDGDHELPDLDPAAVDGWTREVSGLLREVEAVRVGIPDDATGDDREAAGDLELLALALDAERFQLEERRSLETDPLAAIGVAASGIHELLRRTDLPPADQARLVAAAAARARRIPHFVEQAGRLLASSPEPHLQVARGRLAGLVGLVRDELPARADAAGADVGEARDAGAAAADALEAYAALLDELAEEPAADWRLGPEQHARALRTALGSPMSAQEVERRAGSWLEHVTEVLAEHAGAFLTDRGADVPTDAAERTRAALALLSTETVDRTALVEEATRAVDAAHAWAEAEGLVDLPPRELLTITEVPRFLQGVAVAFITAPPAFEPESGCTYYLSPVPDEWDEEQARSFLAEYHRPALHDLALHEAVPGHWVQLEHAARHPRLARRWLISSAFAEGWAVYVERVAVERGFGAGIAGLDPVAYRLSQAKLELRLATNALLDVGLHAGDLDDDGAMELLVGRALQEQAEAAGKLVRGKVTAGQLCSYFVGGEELRDLADAERVRAGGALDLRGFHAKVLSHGTPTTATVAAALADPSAEVRRPFA